MARATRVGQRDAERRGQVARALLLRPSDAREESGPGAGDHKEPGEELPAEDGHGQVGVFLGHSRLCAWGPSSLPGSPFVTQNCP